MSKFQELEKELEAKRCSTCGGDGEYTEERRPGKNSLICTVKKCPDCDDGIRVDEFEKWWKDRCFNGRSSYEENKASMKEAFNAGQDFK